MLKKKFFLKIVLKNNYFFYDIYKINELKNHISICKIRNRCILNGKARSNTSKFRLSRLYLKNLSNTGMLNGIRKK